MFKWMVIGGAAALAYLVTTSRGGRTPAPGQKATPLPTAPPAQQPLPSAQPQTSVVPGANSTFLDDAAKAAGIAGTLADAARKFGLFGSPDTPTSTATAPAATGAMPPSDFPDFATGAAFF